MPSNEERFAPHELGVEHTEARRKMARLKAEMGGRPPPANVVEDYAKPCRETAASRLKAMILRHEAHVRGLKALLEVAERAEPGGDLEETIHALIARSGLGGPP